MCWDTFAEAEAAGETHFVLKQQCCPSLRAPESLHCCQHLLLSESNPKCEPQGGLAGHRDANSYIKELAGRGWMPQGPTLLLSNRI